MSAVTDLTLVEVATRIASGDFSSEEVTQAAITKIEKVQSKLNCFISIEVESALRAAKDADKWRSSGQTLGPLHGVPLAHKDMFYRAGKISTCGSKIQQNFVPTYSATVMKNLEKAGAIYLGGLNMSEFASGPVGHNQYFGACRNPWHINHAPGGSSSGAGSAVAARLVYGALGSDTGGSVRIPAALCGLIGMKGTQGRVSRRGGMPLSFSMDCFGPLARTAQDCARIFSVIAGSDPLDPTSSLQPVSDYEGACSQSITGLRVGLDPTYGGIEPSDEVKVALAKAVEVFRELGAELKQVTIPNQDELNALSNIVTRSEAATVHKAWLRTRRNDYSPQVRRRIEIGLAIPATRYIEALTLRASHLQNLKDMVFKHCDALILPSVGEPAPTLGELDVGDSDALPEMLKRLTGYTRPMNYYGVPAISVPAGFSKTGLPIAFQLVGRPFAEALLFRLASNFQKMTSYHQEAPIVDSKN